MQTYLIQFVSTLVGLLVLDFIWLSLMMKSFYVKYIGHLTSSQPNFLAAGIFYFIYTVGLVVLIVNPAIQGGFSFIKIFLLGALFGFVAYGTYDLTNQATLRDWPVLVTVVDLLWGSLLTGVVSVFAVYITKLFT